MLEQQPTIHSLSAEHRFQSLIQGVAEEDDAELDDDDATMLLLVAVFVAAVVVVVSFEFCALAKTSAALQVFVPGVHFRRPSPE